MPPRRLRRPGGRVAADRDCGIEGAVDHVAGLAGFALLPTSRVRVSRAAPVPLRDLGQERLYLGGLHGYVRVVQQAVHLIKPPGVFGVRQLALQSREPCPLRNRYWFRREKQRTGGCVVSSCGKTIGTSPASSRPSARKNACSRPIATSSSCDSSWRSKSSLKVRWSKRLGRFISTSLQRSVGQRRSRMRSAKPLNRRSC
jgi:hypothetical protein